MGIINVITNIKNKILHKKKTKTNGDSEQAENEIEYSKDCYIQSVLKFKKQIGL